VGFKKNSRNFSPGKRADLEKGKKRTGRKRKLFVNKLMPEGEAITFSRKKVRKFSFRKGAGMWTCTPAAILRN